MPLSIPDSIAEQLEHDTHVIVPTRACALFYRIYLLQTGRCTILKKQAIAAYSELVFPKHLQPVKAPHHVLFALKILEKKALQRALASFFSLPLHSRRIQIQYLIDLLPYIAQCAGDVAFSERYPWIVSLHQEYADFLAQLGLAEPALYEAVATEKTAVLLLPKLHSGAPLPAMADLKTGELHRFSCMSFAEECHRAFSEIALLLDRGIPLHEIVITVCGLPTHRTSITHIAELYDVPIHIVQRQGLSELPGARIIHLISEVLQKNFDIESYAALLLDNTIPWKNPPELQQLIGLGLERDCRAGERERWEYILSSQPEPALLKRFTSIQKRIQAMRDAPSLEAVYKEFVVLLEEHCNLPPWRSFPVQAPAILAIYFVQSQFEEYIQREHQYKNSVAANTQEGWQDFLALYTQLSFVQDATQTSVLVYAYPVSAGIAPRYHFLLNQNYTDSFVTDTIPKSIPEHILKILPIEQNALTAKYAEYYQLSGETIFVSYNKGTNTLDGIPNALMQTSRTSPKIAEPWKKLSTQLRLLHVPPSAPPSALPSTAQQNGTNGTIRFAKSLLQSIHAYAVRMRQAARRAASNFHRQPLSNRSRELLFAQSTASMPVSVSEFNAFARTPYYSFWQKLGLQSGILPIYAFVGMAYHTVLYTCLKKEMEGMLNQEAIPTLEIVRELLASWNLSQFTQFSQPLQRFMTRAIQASLVFLCEKFPHFRVFASESEQQSTVLNHSISGRIDLILEDNAGNTAIIDFKSAYSFEKKSFQHFYQKESIADFEDFQIPCYLYFLREKQIVYAGYVSVEKKTAKHTPVVSCIEKRNPHNPALLSDFAGSFSTFLEDRLAVMHQGNYACPISGCEHCPIPAVCRTYLRSVPESRSPASHAIDAMHAGE